MNCSLPGLRHWLGADPAGFRGRNLAGLSRAISPASGASRRRRSESLDSLRNKVRSIGSNEVALRGPLPDRSETHSLPLLCARIPTAAPQPASGKGVCFRLLHPNPLHSTSDPLRDEKIRPVTRHSCLRSLGLKLSFRGLSGAPSQRPVSLDGGQASEMSGTSYRRRK